MKYLIQPICLLLLAAMVSAALSGCATDPVTREWSWSGTIESNFAAYKAEVDNRIRDIPLNSQRVTDQVNATLADLQGRSNTLVSMFSPAPSTSTGKVGAESDANKPVLLTVLFSLLGVGIHADNRRKDSVLNANKVLKRKRNRASKVVAPAADTTTVTGNGTKGPKPTDDGGNGGKGPKGNGGNGVNEVPPAAAAAAAAPAAAKINPKAPTHEQISTRAAELAKQNPGRSNDDNWHQAEAELKKDQPES